MPIVPVRREGPAQSHSRPRAGVWDAGQPDSEPGLFGGPSPGPAESQSQGYSGIVTGSPRALCPGCEQCGLLDSSGGHQGPEQAWRGPGPLCTWGTAKTGPWDSCLQPRQACRLVCQTVGPLERTLAGLSGSPGPCVHSSSGKSLAGLLVCRAACEGQEWSRREQQQPVPSTSGLSDSETCRLTGHIQLSAPALGPGPRSHLRELAAPPRP